MMKNKIKDKAENLLPKPAARYDVSHIKIRRISKKKFDKMTPAQKRVGLAKDVLLRLQAGKIKEKPGTYLAFCDRRVDKKVDDAVSLFALDEYKVIAELDAQSVFESNKCEVCAKGSIILSWAANFNNVTLQRSYGSSFIKELEGIFPGEMWHAMERAFENASWKLGQIMTWIIDHKGSFPFDGRTYTDDGYEYHGDFSVAPYEFPKKRKSK